MSDLLPSELTQPMTLAPAAAPPVPPAPAPAPAPGAAPPASELVTCPECGSSAMVTLNRRESQDFCRKCDFPLFWTPSTVLRDPAAQSAEESLRRLPGTVGRATVASQPCPHCAEPNALSAQVCVRCGRSMHLEAPPPPPEPVYVPPPPAPVYVEPEKERVAWWVWPLLGLILVLTITLLILGLTHTIG